MSAYGKFFTDSMRGAAQGRDWHAALLVAAYEQDVDAHQTWADVKDWELTGSGYTPGGIPINLEVTYVPELDSILIDCDQDQLSFGVMNTEDAGWLVVYAKTAFDITSTLLSADQFDEDGVITDGAEFIYYVPPEGFVNLGIITPEVVEVP